MQAPSMQRRSLVSTALLTAFLCSGVVFHVACFTLQKCSMPNFAFAFHGTYATVLCPRLCRKAPCNYIHLTGALGYTAGVPQQQPAASVWQQAQGVPSSACAAALPRCARGRLPSPPWSGARRSAAQRAAGGGKWRAGGPATADAPARGFFRGSCSGRPLGGCGCRMRFPFRPPWPVNTILAPAEKRTAGAWRHAYKCFPALDLPKTTLGSAARAPAKARTQAFSCVRVDYICDICV